MRVAFYRNYGADATTVQVDEPTSIWKIALYGGAAFLLWNVLNGNAERWLRD